MNFDYQNIAERIIKAAHDFVALKPNIKKVTHYIITRGQVAVIAGGKYVSDADVNRIDWCLRQMGWLTIHIDSTRIGIISNEAFQHWLVLKATPPLQKEAPLMKLDLIKGIFECRQSPALKIEDLQALDKKISLEKLLFMGHADMEDAIYQNTVKAAVADMIVDAIDEYQLGPNRV